MAAGEGTGRVGRPPLITGKWTTATIITLRTWMTTSCLAHKHSATGC
jgi:hypothetical protein